MFLIFAEALRFRDVSNAIPESAFWRFLAQQEEHAAWIGCTLHDIIQPSFYFLVGVSLFFSLRSRRARGYDFAQLARHTAIRSGALAIIGLGLTAAVFRHWSWSFNDTLTQIALAYPFAFLLAFLPSKLRWSAFTALLVGYWFCFTLYPAPGPDFDYESVGVSAEWAARHNASGLAAHWQKNTNLGSAFDRWFINLLPGGSPFTGSRTGLATLNFIPSVATMLVGLFAAELLHFPLALRARLLRISLSGLGLLLLGLGLAAAGICPIVKSLWTPSWVLFSGGICLLLLAAFSVAIDGTKGRSWGFPFIVIGKNSLIAYCMGMLLPAFAFNALRKIVGPAPFRILGDPYAPILYGCAIICLYWLVLWLLHQRKLFIRV